LPLIVAWLNPPTRSHFSSVVHVSTNLFPPRRIDEWPQMIRRQLQEYEAEQELPADLAAEILGISNLSKGDRGFTASTRQRFYTRVIKEHGNAPLISRSRTKFVDIPLQQEMLEMPLQELKEHVRAMVNNKVDARRRRKESEYVSPWEIHSTLLKDLQDEIKSKFGVKLDSKPPLDVLVDYDPQLLTPFAQRMLSVLKSLPEGSKYLCDWITVGRRHPSSKMFETESAYPLFIPLDASEVAIRRALLANLIQSDSDNPKSKPTTPRVGDGTPRKVRYKRD